MKKGQLKHIKRKIVSEVVSSSSDMLLVLFIHFILDIILRLYEFYLLFPYYENTEKIFNQELNGFYHDNFKFSTLLFIYFPIHLLISYWSKQISRFIIKSFLFSFIVLSFLTVQYFVVSFVPLDQSVFSYSLDEIVKIVMASGDVSWISYVVIIFIVFIFFYLFNNIKFKQTTSTFIIWLIWIITMPNISYSHVKAKFFSSPQVYYIVKNKAIYFIEQSTKYFIKSEHLNNDFSPSTINNLAGNYASIYRDNYYVLPTYPLLRKRNDPDVLGKYFNLGDTLPNIVFIIAESMGNNICGPNARFGSFTPFLDSLINQSLFWENFLSNADRTFGAIPNIIGSLPFGDKSFHDHKEKPLPFHKSLVSHLNENGYYTSFYYGGWNHFNNMDDILKASNINFLLDKFDNDATKIKSDAKDFSWGYDDKSLFKQYLKTINYDSIKSLPRLDIILTLSLHLPFMPPNEEHYLKELEKIAYNSSLKRKEIIKTYKKPLTTVLYADDALRYLFNKYKKRDDFENTIFIITGDHNLHSMPDDNELRQYNVPLIIYSSMLKQAFKFDAIGSHQDIYPSILAMLNHKYKLNLPKVTHAISNGLNASNEFKQNKLIPFFLGRNLNTSILYDGYYFSQDRCYKLSKGMNLKLIENDSIYKKLKYNLQVIKAINKYVYNQDKIIPLKYR